MLDLAQPLVRAVVEDSPLDTVDDAIALLTHLVDLTDPRDKIGTALSMLVADRDAWRRRATDMHDDVVDSHAETFGGRGKCPCSECAAELS